MRRRSGCRSEVWRDGLEGVLGSAVHINILGKEQKMTDYYMIDFSKSTLTGTGNLKKIKQY